MIGMCWVCLCCLMRLVSLMLVILGIWMLRMMVVNLFLRSLCKVCFVVSVCIRW